MALRDNRTGGTLEPPPIRCLLPPATFSLLWTTDILSILCKVLYKRSFTPDTCDQIAVPKILPASYSEATGSGVQPQHSLLSRETGVVFPTGEPGTLHFVTVLYSNSTSAGFQGHWMGQGSKGATAECLSRCCVSIVWPSVWLHNRYSINVSPVNVFDNNPAASPRDLGRWRIKSWGNNSPTSWISAELPVSPWGSAAFLLFSFLFKSLQRIWKISFPCVRV